MSPKEAATQIGRTVQQFNPLRTAVGALVLAFMAGGVVTAFFSSPLSSVRQANAAQDTAIATLQEHDTVHAAAIHILMTNTAALIRIGCLQLTPAQKQVSEVCQ